MQNRKVQGPTWVILWLFVAVLTSFAQDNASPGTGDWRVWLEPKFMRAPVALPIAGAKKTEIAIGRMIDAELQPFTKDSFQQLSVTPEEFSKTARPNAAADLAGLKPEYIRNKRKVIEYAVLRSEKPIIASAVLAPGFCDLFEETLGPKVFVVVPSRYVAFVFPALASNYRDYSPMVFREYRASAFPVSVEVFELSRDGLRTIGAYEEP